MLANDLTLDKADGTDAVFRLISQSNDGSKRIDIATNLSLPSTLIIKHSVTGKAPALIDRHLIQLNKTVAAAIGSATTTVNLTLTVPRDPAITSVVIHDVISNLLDLLTDSSLTGFVATTNVDAILRGES